MDWIEEKAEQLKQKLQDASLFQSLVLYLCAAVMGAFVFHLFTRNLCAAWLNVLQSRYHGEIYGRGAGNGLVQNFLNADSFISKEPYSRNDTLVLYVTVYFYNYNLVIYMLLAFAAAGRMFQQKKLYPAILAMSEVLNAINAGDYGREISYHSKDELGDLCQNVEQTRKKLVREKQRQWDRQEGQRRINAAFAHDIRTPVTVMQGYTEFLQKYIPQGKISQEMLLEKLGTMREQEERLLKFSVTMTTIQDMEKREVHCEWNSFCQIRQRLWEVVEGIRQKTDIQLVFEAAWNNREGGSHKEKGEAGNRWRKEPEIFADTGLILEVLENLMNNAQRYASHFIHIRMEQRDQELTLYVKDDGPGFSEKALRQAADAYFSEAGSGAEHFGIGLSISRILCESHNGGITFSNSVEGGAITAASFGVGTR